MIQWVINKDSVVQKERLERPINPYKKINYILKKQIQNNKFDIKLHFAPLIHILFDQPEYIESLLNDNPIALKIHGIGSGTHPERVNHDILKLIREYNKPLIIHTDYNKYDNTSNLGFMSKANSPIAWISLLMKYEIRTVLTHGVRLCKESMNIINSEQLFAIGVGPDFLLNTERNRLYYDKNYLETLLNLADHNKLLFDLDYPWNITVREENSLDQGSLKRIENIVNDKGILDKIVYENAVKFFGM